MQNGTETRVVVTGIGTINPIGSNVREYHENLLKGKSGVRRIRSIPDNDYFVQIAGEIDLPDNIEEYFPSKKQIKRLDRYILFGHIAATEALRDSGLDVEQAPHRYGALIGTGDGGIEAHLTNVTKIATKGIRHTSPFYVINCIPNTCTGFFAMCWNLQGPCFSINSACATGNHSIGTGVMMIKMGICDALFVGGSEAPVNKIGLCAFGNIQALSERNDSPETASRPFDKDRDGLVLGEGAGILCIESLEHAKKRGARIYCEITGFGFSCDAHDFVAPHPEGRGAANAMSLALEQARLSPDSIGLINAHATSTSLGDIVEYKAVRRVFKERADSVPVHSTKSMTGHLLGGASGIEAIAAIQVLTQGVAHPTINQFEQDKEIGFSVITNQPREMKIDHVLSSGFGFGGQNASVILSRFNG